MSVQSVFRVHGRLKDILSNVWSNVLRASSSFPTLGQVCLKMLSTITSWVCCTGRVRKEGARSQYIVCTFDKMPYPCSSWRGLAVICNSTEHTKQWRNSSPVEITFLHVTMSSDSQRWFANRFKNFFYDCRDVLQYWNQCFCYCVFYLCFEKNKEVIWRRAIKRKREKERERERERATIMGFSHLKLLKDFVGLEPSST